MTSPDPYNHPLPKAKRRGNALGVAILIATAVIVLCTCFGIIGAMSSDDESDEGLRADRAPNATATYAAPATAKPKAKPAATKAPTIGEGEWLVGEDVPAGKYRTPGARDGLMTYCSWIITADGGDGELIDAGSVSSTTAPGRATLKVGQEFQTSGCEPWVKAK